MNQQQTIMLIEDEDAIADAVLFTLQHEGFRVRRHSLGKEGLADFRNNGAELIILDVGLPDISGLAVCREIRTASEVPILFLTARNDEIDRIMGLELGGDDYVAKPFSLRELVARVHAILRRTHRANAQTLQAKSEPQGLFAVDDARGIITYSGTELSLTRYEYLVLKALLSQPERVFSRSQLMEWVWESPENSLERSVDTHIKTLRAKLREVRPEFDPIVTKRGFGYTIRIIPS
ncbi:two-component system response regulator CreB [Oleidesulfovibrio sp.]|uniref:two-component system response regulator CreB n=1 Tax=Oleidesulfovibrio sp. TaxID=2909707 RepID=UPI003A8549BD